MEINHCREGRIEFESNDGEGLYLKKGDMAICIKASLKDASYFPQCHYHGITIEIDMNLMENHNIQMLKDFKLDPVKMKESFCRSNRCFILHEKDEFEHLFAELYCVPEKIKKRYYKIKIAEILLFLSVIDVEKEQIENRYFNKEQAAKVKEIHGYMIAHLDKKITIELLSDKFQIAQTTLKKCFRDIYGNSIYAYLKECRIREAARLLRSTELEINNIAGMVGYDNASKFATSFKSVIGINPNQYRKNV